MVRYNDVTGNTAQLLLNQQSTAQILATIMLK
jgi:hypothetical protein